MIRPLDCMLYLSSAILTAAGLTLVKWLLPEGGWSSVLDFSDPRLLLALAGAIGLYGAGLGAWLWAIARNPLSTAYPIGIGLSLTTVVLAAAIFLGESLTLAKIAGTGMIMLGAAAITRGRP